MSQTESHQPQQTIGFCSLKPQKKTQQKRKKKSIKLQFLMHTHNLLSPKDIKKHIQFQFQTRINKRKKKDWKIGSEPRLTACVRTCRIWRDLMESTVSPIQPILTVSFSLSLSLSVTEIKANPRFILLLMFGCASYNAGELLFL